MPVEVPLGRVPTKGANTVCWRLPYPRHMLSTEELPATLKLGRAGEWARMAAGADRWAGLQPRWKGALCNSEQALKRQVLQQS